MDTETRASILTNARSWIGTPYHHKGRVKGVGVDCGGLIYELFAPHLPLAPFPTDYPADWALHKDNELYLAFIREHVREVPRVPDFGLVMFKYGLCYSHGGLVTDRRTVIHAWGRTKEGRVMESDFKFFRFGADSRERKYYEVAA